MKTEATALCEAAEAFQAACNALHAAQHAVEAGDGGTPVLEDVETVYSDGTRATTRPDPFGNQVTTYSDGRRETIRPDPFSSAPPKKDGANERK